MAPGLAPGTGGVPHGLPMRDAAAAAAGLPTRRGLSAQRPAGHGELASPWRSPVRLTGPTVMLWLRVAARYCTGL